MRSGPHILDLESELNIPGRLPVCRETAIWLAWVISSKVYFREGGGLDIQAVRWRCVNVVLSIIMGSGVGGLGFVWGISSSKAALDSSIPGSRILISISTSTTL